MRVVVGLSCCLLLLGANSVIASQEGAIDHLPAPTVARAALERFFQAACDKNMSGIEAAMTPDAIFTESDHGCLGPLNRTQTIHVLPKKYKFFSLMLRPIGAMIAVRGTPSSPQSRDVSFAAYFNDIGVMPVSVRNETDGKWSFLTDSIVRGIVDGRTGLLAQIHLHMPWSSPENTAMINQAAMPYLSTLTYGTLDEFMDLFLDNATITSAALQYKDSLDASMQGNFKRNVNKTEYREMLRIPFQRRLFAQYKASAVAAGCQQVSVFNTVMFEQSNSTVGGGRHRFIAFGTHTFDVVFIKGIWKISHMEFTQWEGIEVGQDAHH